MSECLKCGGVMNEHRHLTFDGEVRDERISIVMPGLKCANCGHQTVPGTEMAEFMRRAADAYRSKHMLLTSEAIRARRNALGMTQEEFAEWLPAGVASVRRWELGAVQDAAMDALIRLKTDPVEAQETAKATKQLLNHKMSLRRAQMMIRGARERPRTKKVTGSRKAAARKRPGKIPTKRRSTAAR